MSEPNRAWVTDIAYSQIYDVFMFLAVVLDPFSPSSEPGDSRPRLHLPVVMRNYERNHNYE